MPDESSSRSTPLNFDEMQETAHKIDTNLLIQDSHVHLMMFAVLAALQTLIVLGLGVACLVARYGDRRRVRLGRSRLLRAMVDEGGAGWIRLAHYPLGLDDDGPSTWWSSSERHEPHSDFTRKQGGPNETL